MRDTNGGYDEILTAVEGLRSLHPVDAYAVDWILRNINKENKLSYSTKRDIQRVLDLCAYAMEGGRNGPKDT
jgi:hypothetical protein